MSSFLIHGRPFDRLDECLRFLDRRQNRSTDPMLNGGWPVNTSFGQPVSEATALVARLLAITRVTLVDDASRAERATQWLTANQNDDGGWGSFRGQTSRIWLTSMSIRALSELNPHTPAMRRGVEWLMAQRHPTDRVWGERPAATPTVTHTAYALCALVDSRLSRVVPGLADAVDAGYTWLATHLDPNAVHDDAARFEEYNVNAGVTLDSRHLVWHNTIWHPGLPFAVSALLRQPDGLNAKLLYRAVRTILRTQLDDGRWPSADSAATVSVWTVWPFLETLAEVVAHGQEPVVTVVGPSTLVVQHGRDRDTSVASVLWRSIRGQGRRALRQWWAAFLLLLVTVVGGLLVTFTKLGWREFALGMLLPVILTVVQTAMTRTRNGR